MREGKPYGRRAADQGEYCPQCHNNVQAGHMDSHMYSAHGVDRRKTAEQKTPPPPEKKQRQTTTPKDDGGEEGPKKPKNRWFDRPPSGG